jgi:REP element-mobilizing transposase RayT
MSEKFDPQIPHRHSIRLYGYDYSQAGLYFITICTKNHQYLFGKIVSSEMQLSSIGEIVQQEWNKSFEIRNELFCDLFTIMPNHIHAILRIENNVAVKRSNIETHTPVGTHNHVWPHGRASQKGCSYQQGWASQQGCASRHGVAYRSPKSISSFVAGFKSSATARINEYRHTPKSAVWQPRFHDHVIRNDDEYYNIVDYIINNPACWEQDKYFVPTTEPLLQPPKY